MFPICHSVLVKDALLYEVGHPLCGQRVHLFAKEGVITNVSTSARAMPTLVDCTIQGEEVGLSPGWMDLRANFCDPGFQKKEDLHSGTMAAAAGGFVGVHLVPHTQPAVRTQSVVQYIKHKADNTLVRLYPMGAFSADAVRGGLSDMLQMHEAGVSIFTHDDHAVNDAHLLLQALRYVMGFDGLIVETPQDFCLSRMGSVHEGQTSTQMGLQGVPAVSEEIAVYRGLRLLDYSKSRLHFSCITTAGSLELIRRAKRRGLPVSCDVSLHHLLFDDTALLHFDTQHKVHPPYRGKRDRQALLRGVRTNVVDAIVSSHTPQHAQDKEDAFLTAAYGNITLQTAFSVLNSIKDVLPLALSLPKLYEGPYRVTGLSPPSLTVGASACFTVFDSSRQWRFHAATSHSKSVNSPFYGKTMRGEVLATVRDSFVFLPG